MTANFAAVNIPDEDKTGNSKAPDVQNGPEEASQVDRHEDNGSGPRETSGNGEASSPTSQPQTGGKTVQPLPYFQQLLSRSSSSSLSEATNTSHSNPEPTRAGDESVTVEKRTLPSRSITESTIDDAYVQFILYCNPAVPMSIKTGELRRAFRAIPRTEGKSFDIFALWLLVQKLYRGELRSWTQLVHELGVAPPSKDDSPQKVAQYVSRLKRWMRCMHIDAFFSYCFGHNHDYYTRIPSPGDANGTVRDGIAAEDDLVLKALYPESRARRGRKPIPEQTAENDQPGKRARIDSTGKFSPRSSVGQSNGRSGSPLLVSQVPPQDGRESALRQQTGPPSHFLTFRFDQPSHHPPYPQSAVTPSYRDSDHYALHEPRSAIIPPSQIHAESESQRSPPHLSPWASSNTAQPTFHRSSNSGTDAETVLNTPMQPPAGDRADQAAPKPTLSLQVPQNPSGPAPFSAPTVLINGKDRANPPASEVNLTKFRQSYADNSVHASVSIELVAQAVREQLLRNISDGPSNAFSPDDVAAIANSLIKHLETQCQMRLNPEIFALYCAIFLGVGPNVGVGGPLPFTSFDISRDAPTDPARSIPAAQYTVTYRFSLAQNPASQATNGGCSASGGLHSSTREGGLSSEGYSKEKTRNRNPDDDFDEDDPLNKPGSSGPDWKQRYLDLRRQVRKRDEALQQYKKRILEAVISDPSLL